MRLRLYCYTDTPKHVAVPQGIIMSMHTCTHTHVACVYVVWVQTLFSVKDQKHNLQASKENFLTKLYIAMKSCFTPPWGFCFEYMSWRQRCHI